MRYLILTLFLCSPASAGMTSGGGSQSSVSASSANATYVNKAGDTMTGAITVADEIAISGAETHLHGLNLHIHPETVDGTDTSSVTIAGGGNTDANHFTRGGAARFYGNEETVNPGDAILQAGTVSGGEVRLMTNGVNQLVIDQSGNTVMGSGATKSTFTTAGYFQLLQRTKAQLDAVTPAVGDQVLCSDCTVPYDLCVATGATLSGFRATINSAINTAVTGTLVAKGCGTNN